MPLEVGGVHDEQGEELHPGGHRLKALRKLWAPTLEKEGPVPALPHLHYGPRSRKSTFKSKGTVREACADLKTASSSKNEG